MPRASIPVEQVLAALAQAPQRIAEMTAGLTPEQLEAAPAAGQWSANEVLAHLRSCADVWGGCIDRILAEEKPTVRAIDPRTWIKNTDYLDLEFGRSLRAYAAQRADLLVILKPLRPEQLARTATMTGSGAPIERSLFSFAQRLARHERPHLKQIARIAAAMRANAHI